jgi:Animal haem peroxidase
MSNSKQPGASNRYHDTLFWRAVDTISGRVDRKVGWDQLPKVLGLAVLIGLRDTLRRFNLHDANKVPSTNLAPLPAPDPLHLTQRSVDGTYNDLGDPRMGSAGTRFGRNIPLDAIVEDSRADKLRPSPREVSRALMTRKELIEATSVNALVAPWLQFMIRDWFSHGKSPTDNPWEVALAEDDDWPDRPMRIMRVMDDPTRPASAAGQPPTFVNTSSHWWDASQIYGQSLAYQKFVRAGHDGKLRVEPDGSLPLPPGKTDGNPTEEPGFWIGLAMLQTLFTYEHNAVCDMLRGNYPTWTDEELFQRARLIIAALIAKIHTVEWTPAVISHPTTVTGMRANWFGLAGERVKDVFGRISTSEVISGIPGAATEQYGVPFSLTEEFGAVYRMHPLAPDDWSIRAAADDRTLGDYTLRDFSGPGAMAVLGKTSMPDLFYSFGTLHPGLVSLHNFPRFLQEFVRPDGKLMDLAATDILRHREMGVPRYCEFRRQMHLDAPTTFDQLTTDRATAVKMNELYDGDIERLDLMVGLFAEDKPTGFAFSDTAFRIFILMASRRLNSDRFFTKDFTPAVYTKQGLDWVAENSMATVLLRHWPSLRPAMRGVDNAFLPWTRTGT